MKNKAIIFISFLLFNSFLINAQSVNWLTAEFSLEIVKQTSTKSKGKIYFGQPDQLVLMVNEPLYQTMLYKDNQLIIYYPETDKILEFEDTSIESLSFFQGLLRALEDRNDGTKTGFNFKSSFFENDTLYMIYQTPEDHPTLRMEMTNVYFDKMLIYNYILGKDEKLVAKSKYSNYKNVNDMNMPHKIEILSYDKSGNVTYNERVSFQDVKINHPIDFNKILPQKLYNK